MLELYKKYRLSMCLPALNAEACLASAMVAEHKSNGVFASIRQPVYAGEAMAYLLLFAELAGYRLVAPDDDNCRAVVYMSNLIEAHILGGYRKRRAKEVSIDLANALQALNAIKEFDETSREWWFAKQVYVRKMHADLEKEIGIGFSREELREHLSSRIW